MVADALRDYAGAGCELTGCSTVAGSKPSAPRSRPSMPASTHNSRHFSAASELDASSRSTSNGWTSNPLCDTETGMPGDMSRSHPWRTSISARARPVIVSIACPISSQKSNRRSVPECARRARWVLPEIQAAMPLSRRQTHQHTRTETPPNSGHIHSLLHHAT